MALATGTDLSPAARELLVRLVRAQRFCIGFDRPSKSPERDRLKRLGFIQSVPARGGGHGKRWIPTPAGAEWFDNRESERS